MSKTQSNNHRPSFKALHAGFALIIFFIIGLTALSLYRTHSLHQQLQVIVNDYTYRATLVHSMRIAARERINSLYAAALTQDPFERDEHIQELYRFGSEFLSTRTQLLASPPPTEELAYIDRHRQLARQFSPDQDQVVSLLVSQQLETARELLYQTAAPGQARALQVLDEYYSFLDKRIKDTTADVARSVDDTLKLLSIFALAGIVISLIIARWVYLKLKQMVFQLNEARQNLEIKVAQRTSELQQATHELQRQAHYDSLTQLPNRRLFYQQIKQFLSLARRQQRILGLLYIDLDGFKAVNDDYGHDYGDELLRQVADRLRKVIRTEDSAARLAGDEFAILLVNLKETQSIETVARRAIDAIARPYIIEDQQIIIGSSIGIAYSPGHADEVDALVAKADEAMYLVKRSGKNNFQVHSELHT